MTVLVGIVSKNRCGILPRAIDSALLQKGVDVSVAVVDDHSDDDTRSLEKKYPGVQWTFLEENKGYVFARNKMMSESGTTYYCSLDDDSWFLSDDTLAQAVEYMEKHPEVAAAGFEILSPDRPHGKKIDAPYFTNNFIGCGHVLRLSAVREVSYYDPNPGFYGGEEKDMCLKLMNKGYSIVALPGLHVWHDKTSVARNEKAQHRSGVCNDLAFLYRRAPLAILVPGLMIKVVKHLNFSIRYKNGTLFRAGVSGLVDFFALMTGFKLVRKPVSTSAFRQYSKLNRHVGA